MSTYTHEDEADDMYNGTDSRKMPHMCSGCYVEFGPNMDRVKGDCDMAYSLDVIYKKMDEQEDFLTAKVATLENDLYMEEQHLEEAEEEVENLQEAMKVAEALRHAAVVDLAAAVVEAKQWEEAASVAVSRERQRVEEIEELKKENKKLFAAFIAAQFEKFDDEFDEAYKNELHKLVGDKE